MKIVQSFHSYNTTGALLVHAGALYIILLLLNCHLIKNILYLKRCRRLSRILVDNKTYVENLIGLLIPPRLLFLSLFLFLSIYIYIYIYIYMQS